MQRFLLCYGFVLVFGLREVRAEELDDKYVRIYNLIQEADTRVAGEQLTEAQASYREAQRALRALQKARPDWNPQVVQFRLRYVAEKLQAIAADAPTKPEPNERTKVPAPDESTTPLNLLQDQVRQLTADRHWLQARLTEALAAQPAAVDPRELQKAEDRIRTLEKELELLRVNLLKADSATLSPLGGEDKGEGAKAGTTPHLDPLRLERGEEKASNASRRRSVPQTQNDPLFSPLRGEKKESERAQIKKLRASLAESRSRYEALLAEKQILEKRLNELESHKEKELKAKTGPLEKALADARIQAQASAAKISVLEAALQMARDDKAAIERANRELPARSAAAKSPAELMIQAMANPSVQPAEARRIRDLEAQRDELQRKVSALNRELHDQQARGMAYAAQLTNQLANFRARLDVLEARMVPYSAEEIALLRIPALTLPRIEEHNPRKPGGHPPAGSGQPIAESERAFNARRLDEAAKKYEQVLSVDDRNIEMLGNLAAVQIEQNRLVEAEKTLRRALAEAPQNAFSLTLLGVIRVRQRKYDEALEVLSRSAQLNPQSAETHQYLGVVLVHKGLRGPAEAAFRRAIELAPGYADAHHNLAVVYLTQKPPWPELARWHYQKALAEGHPRNLDLENALNGKRTTAATK
jgi:Tfp pilus assembly protein PilF